MNVASTKTLYNVAGAVLGTLLAGLSIFGLIQTQQTSQPQHYQSKITYDG